MTTPSKPPEQQDKPQPGHKHDRHQEEEDALDETIEESFPASDPPSSIPNPADDEDAA